MHYLSKNNLKPCQGDAQEQRGPGQELRSAVVGQRDPGHPPQGPHHQLQRKRPVEVEVVVGVVVGVVGVVVEVEVVVGVVVEVVVVVGVVGVVVEVVVVVVGVVVDVVVVVGVVVDVVVGVEVEVVVGAVVEVDVVVGALVEMEVVVGVVVESADGTAAKHSMSTTRPSVRTDSRGEEEEDEEEVEEEEEEKQSQARGWLSWPCGRLPECGGDMAHVDAYAQDRSLALQLVVWSLRGVARVTLANNPLSGALVLAALLWASPWQALLGALCWDLVLVLLLASCWDAAACTFVVERSVSVAGTSLGTCGVRVPFNNRHRSLPPVHWTRQPVLPDRPRHAAGALEHNATELKRAQRTFRLFKDAGSRGEEEEDEEEVEEEEEEKQSQARGWLSWPCGRLPECGGDMAHVDAYAQGQCHGSTVSQRAGAREEETAEEERRRRRETEMSHIQDESAVHAVAATIPPLPWRRGGSRARHHRLRMSRRYALWEVKSGCLPFAMSCPPPPPPHCSEL
ncbi:hypothetical protein CRUP_009114 [Coryphaenoides rupestris]|nr:hypothetical protein CRUP_009114 [Coryphaenoides rupestris]